MFYGGGAYTIKRVHIVDDGLSGGGQGVREDREKDEVNRDQESSVIHVYYTHSVVQLVVAMVVVVVV